MKFHLVLGTCGFVGRNMVKRLLTKTNDNILMIDDLSLGIHPSKWIIDFTSEKSKDLEIIKNKKCLYFLKGDFKKILTRLNEDHNYIQNSFGLSL